MKDILISLILLVLLIIFNIYVSKKNKIVYKSHLYKKIKKLKSFLYLLSIITFIAFLIITLLPLGSRPLFNEIITCIVNSFSVSLIIIPLSLESLYIRFFNEEEKYSHIKTIVTNIYDKELYEKINTSDINIILLSLDKTKLKSIKEDQVKTSLLNETLQIKTDNIKILDKLINKENTLKEYKDLNNLYKKIEHARNTHDNYIRTIKYIVSSYLPLLLSYIFLTIMKFPVFYNILLITILKIIITLKTELLFKHLPYDKDVMKRLVKPSNIVFTNQEVLFLIMESFVISFTLTMPYMFILAKGGSKYLAYTILIVTYIIINTLLSYYYLNDSSYIKNIFKYIKNIRLHIFTIVSIILIVAFNYTTYFSTKNITLQNNIGCLIISIVTILLLEITKLARYTTMKGKETNELKNNKKYRRS